MQPFDIMTFIPPNPKKFEPPRYATYIEDRRPQFKVHRLKSHAYAAVNYRYYSTPRGGVIYELIDGEWQELETVTRSNKSNRGK